MEEYIWRVLGFKGENKIEVVKKVEVMVGWKGIGIGLVGIMEGFIWLGGYLIWDGGNGFVSGMVRGFGWVIGLVGSGLVWVGISM